MMETEENVFGWNHQRKIELNYFEKKNHSKCPPPGNLGPGSYEVKLSRPGSFNRKSTPFLCGMKKRETDLSVNNNPVGVGRYNLDKKQNVQCTAIMKSATPRFLDTESVYYLNERIRSKDTHFSDFLLGKSVQ